MIVVTNRDTCKAAYVDERWIQDIREMSDTDNVSSRVYLFSRIHVVNDKLNYDYFLDAIESKKKINQLIDEAKNKPIPEKQGPEPPVDP